MKKIFSIALILAVVTSLCFGSVALAQEPPKVTVDWNLADNPDIRVDSLVGDDLNYRASWFDLEGTGPSHGFVTASANSSIDATFTASGTEINAGVEKLRQSSTSGYWQYSKCAFSLTGSSSVTGSVSGSTDWGAKYPGLNLEGGYDGSGSEGSFSSSFSGYTYFWRGWHSTEYLSAHSITATGVNGMHVEGDANAYPSDKAHVMGAGQEFSGEAEWLEVQASRLTGNLDNNPTGAQFTSTVTAGSTTSFLGSTEDRYYQTDHHIPGLVLPEERSGGTPIDSYSGKYGLGFQIGATGCSIDNTFISDYSYSVIRGFVNPDAEYPDATAGVYGESATWATEVDGKTYPDYPGYFVPPEP